MYIEMMETRPREQSMSALLTLAEVKADSVYILSHRGIGKIARVRKTIILC